MYQFFTIGNLKPVIIRSRSKAEKVISELKKLQAVIDFAKTADENVWLVLTGLGKSEFRNLINLY